MKKKCSIQKNTENCWSKTTLNVNDILNHMANKFKSSLNGENAIVF